MASAVASSANTARRLRTHARTMAMLMIALVLMTLLSLMPGRLMHDVVFGG